MEDIILNGTPDEVISQIEQYMKNGLEHLVLVSMTALGDPMKSKSSNKCMKKVLTYFKN